MIGTAEGGTMALNEAEKDVRLVQEMIESKMTVGSEGCASRIGPEPLLVWEGHGQSSCMNFCGRHWICSNRKEQVEEKPREVEVSAGRKENESQS